MSDGEEEESGEKVDSLKIMSDLEADEVYKKMTLQSKARKGYIKKNWTKEEANLLKWAVITYSRRININYSNLVSVIRLWKVFTFSCLSTDSHLFLIIVYERLDEHCQIGAW